MDKYQAIQKKYLVSTYADRGITITNGKGAKLYNVANKEYIDCMSAIGVNILGHNNDYLNQALSEQLTKLYSLHSSLNNDTRSEALEAMTNYLPKALSRIYFASTGTECVEAALKFAFLITGRSRFIAAKHGYHGKTLGSLPATTSSQKKYQKDYHAIIKMENFDFIEFNNLTDAENKITEKHAAVIIEPIQGEGGVITAKNGYLKKLQQICEEKGVLLIIDEIQTGMGRTGKLFNFEYHDIIPDILCSAKGLGGGVPTGAVILKRKYNSKIPRGAHTSTFGGNPLSCSGIKATLEYIFKNKLLEKAKTNGDYFIKELKQIKEKNPTKIKEVRGQGLMIGLELKEKALPVIKKMQDLGVLAVPSGEKVIRFLPPLVIEKEEIEKVVEVVEESLG
jgi:acetylornithine/LysW-gamma-L-lysine aminotransferase